MREEDEKKIELTPRYIDFLTNQLCGEKQAADLTLRQLFNIDILASTPLEIINLDDCYLIRQIDNLRETYPERSKGENLPKDYSLLEALVVYCKGGYGQGRDHALMFFSDIAPKYHLDCSDISTIRLQGKAVGRMIAVYFADKEEKG